MVAFALATGNHLRLDFPLAFLAAESFRAGSNAIGSCGYRSGQEG